ncbi:hypothetical protein HZS55_07605 [Halosimplex rubrum]|uniref:Uncharacterized protein n=1 Tax=Halosimplex rubrum TaxID=869889 RepID=A0A7D5SPY3_9EURY|nr:hypothetical protein [Halosimplex rubrum]QLH77167.1 hypothetical protein HZS55_07605 [Halosimplex rubrum]
MSDRRERIGWGGVWLFAVLCGTVLSWRTERARRARVHFSRLGGPLFERVVRARISRLSDRERVEGFQCLLSSAVTSIQSERVEGFQCLLSSAVTSIQSERVEGFHR